MPGYGDPPKESQFKPGQSGNPKGQPRKTPEIEELLAEVLGEDGSEAKLIIQALIKKAKKGDVRAAEVVFDRAFGKAKQFIKTDVNGEFIVRWQRPSVRRDEGSA